MLEILIKESEFSKKEIANKAGITVRAIDYYLKGQREMKVSVARKLAEVLKVNWWELYEE
ncbi:helix-turn-helix domain-containing protein [Helcococcus kunzii]|uniref:helix-turn-helix domain-containing protein n=1 Tax=Helcococcus kunzii TaxID=40091 RepID=UPI0024AE32F9|nr:helix-turn-helix transcriptional regulator [Helcococcus kunzii]